MDRIVDGKTPISYGFCKGAILCGNSNRGGSISLCEALSGPIRMGSKPLEPNQKADGDI